MAVNIYGHFSRHPKKLRVRSQPIPASAIAPGPQRIGSISFGAPNFLKAMECTNKFLGDGAQVTITVLTR